MKNEDLFSKTVLKVGVMLRDHAQLISAAMTLALAVTSKSAISRQIISRWLPPVQDFSQRNEKPGKRGCYKWSWLSEWRMNSLGQPLPVAGRPGRERWRLSWEFCYQVEWAWGHLFFWYLSSSPWKMGSIILTSPQSHLRSTDEKNTVTTTIIYWSESPVKTCWFFRDSFGSKTSLRLRVSKYVLTFYFALQAINRGLSCTHLWHGAHQMLPCLTGASHPFDLSQFVVKE